MQSKNLLIVFAKNILLGKVKTRLAATIGDTGAFEVYKTLVEITEMESNNLEDCDIRVYWSDVIIDTKWKDADRFVQSGSDLGERMQNAFLDGFESGYERIIGIGTDLPDITAGIMKEALFKLETVDTVFGPAEDGGYYLIGMNHMVNQVFENKAWSTEFLLKETTDELVQEGKSFALLKELNDIDTLEDLMNSSVSERFKELYELFRGNK